MSSIYIRFLHKLDIKLLKVSFRQTSATDVLCVRQLPVIDASRWLCWNWMAEDSVNLSWLENDVDQSFVS